MYFTLVFSFYLTHFLLHYYKSNDLTMLNMKHCHNITAVQQRLVSLQFTWTHDLSLKHSYIIMKPIIIIIIVSIVIRGVW